MKNKSNVYNKGRITVEPVDVADSYALTCLFCRITW